MWLLLAVWQCHSVTRSEQGLGLRQGQCLLIFAQLIRKRYGQAHYQRTATATATTFRSYSGAHNRCADMLVPVHLAVICARVCVCVSRQRGVAAKPQWHQWAISTMWRWCRRSPCSFAGLATPSYLLCPYPMATPAQHIVCVCGSGGAAHRCKTDKTASRLPALGIPNLTHVAHCNCKCLSFRHAAPN